MSEFADWLVGLIKALFGFIWDFISDILIHVLDLFLTALVQAFHLVLVPCFMSVGSALSMSTALTKIPTYVWFFAGNLGLADCFKILSCAIIFVFARKLLTLFQW